MGGWMDLTRIGEIKKDKRQEESRERNGFDKYPLARLEEREGTRARAQPDDHFLIGMDDGLSVKKAKRRLWPRDDPIRCEYMDMEKT